MAPRHVPAVSVVVPFLNAERFLGEAIESVLEQTFSDWELFLVDDGSSDASTGLARSYASRNPQRIRYVEHTGHANRGISASRNLGIAHARGRYVASLDSDDVWLPRKLEQQVALAEAHPAVSMVYGLSVYWYGWTGRPQDRERDFVPDLGIPGDRVYSPGALSALVYPLGTGTAAPPSDWLVRREAMERVNGFEEAFTGPFGLYEDHAFLAKMYLHGSVFVSSEVWEKYRIHPDSYMARVKATGGYPTVRSFFLKWLEQYLKANAIDDRSVWGALDHAMANGPVEQEISRMGKWTLRRAGGSAGELLPAADRDVVRLQIHSVPTSTSFDLQLNIPRLRIEAGHQYVVKFRARGDARRALSFGFAEAHSPWCNLGLYRDIELTTDWQDFEGRFTAPVDESNGRIHFDAGASDISLELAAIQLLRIHDGAPSGEVVEPSEHSALRVREPGARGQTHDPTPVPAAPRVGQVQFGSFRRLSPISENWGWDRGQPIDRYYIEDFLGRQASHIRGRVLEVGDDTYTRQFGGSRVTASDVLHVSEASPGATIVADLSHAPNIPSDTFDCVVLTQTLQLIFDVPASVRTLYRILKPGGTLLVTVPGISQTYDEEWSHSWYWAFTPHSLLRVLGASFSAEQVGIEEFGNVLAAMCFLQGISAEELTLDELMYPGRGYAVTIAATAIKSAQPGP